MTCAHRNLHPGRQIALDGSIRTACRDCDTLLHLTTVRMTPEQTADVTARLDADDRYHTLDRVTPCARCGEYFAGDEIAGTDRNGDPLCHGCATAAVAR